jgi:hypothetical protein
MSVSTDDNLPKKMEWLQRDWYDLRLGVVTDIKDENPNFKCCWDFPSTILGESLFVIWRKILMSLSEKHLNC